MQPSSICQYLLRTADYLWTQIYVLLSFPSKGSKLIDQSNSTNPNITDANYFICEKLQNKEEKKPETNMFN